MKRYKSVDAYIDGAEHWQDELRRLREILNSTDLVEEVKWGGPCYTYDGKNMAKGSMINIVECSGGGPDSDCC